MANKQQAASFSLAFAAMAMAVILLAGEAMATRPPPQHVQVSAEKNNTNNIQKGVAVGVEAKARAKKNNNDIEKGVAVGVEAKAGAKKNNDNTQMGVTIGVEAKAGAKKNNGNIQKSVAVGVEAKAGAKKNSNDNIQKGVAVDVETKASAKKNNDNIQKGVTVGVEAKASAKKNNDNIQKGVAVGVEAKGAGAKKKKNNIQKGVDAVDVEAKVGGEKKGNDIPYRSELEFAVEACKQAIILSKDGMIKSAMAKNIERGAACDKAISYFVASQKSISALLHPSNMNNMPSDVEVEKALNAFIEFEDVEAKQAFFKCVDA